MIFLRFGFGIVLGLFFYGGLWLTVRRLPDCAYPTMLSLGSLILRMSLTLGGFVILIGGRWQNAAAALAGFTAASFLLPLLLRLGVLLRLGRSTPCT